MADENTPAFYPRVGQNIAKNFRSAQPPAFIEDPRAMDLPQYGDVDLSVPTQANLEMSRRMAQRQADLKRQQERDRSPLEKAAGVLQTGRLMGSALTQAINSLPTRLVHGDEAADKFMQDRMYKPEQPLAYEYAGDVGNFLERLETEYKLPPILPEAVALQYLTGPATSQAMRTAGRGAEKAGRAIERRMEPVVKGALERGGLPREMVMAMGANTQSNVIKPPNGNWFGTSLPESMVEFKRNTVAGNDPALILGEMRERYTPEAIANMQDPSRAHIADSFAMLEKDVALNNWVDRNLTNYVKKQMATPEDPVRKLAEEGIVHIPTSEVGVNRYRAPEHRNRYGGEQLGQSEAAKAWEDASDVAINAPKVEEIISPGFIDRNPYVEKLPLDERIYGLNSPASYSQEIKGLGFDHIIDVLREDVASGRIRPEQLNKVSMEQAVRRTYEYDQELARRMNEARATSRAELPVYKEYPEGLKWVELNRPGDFAAESDAMGHSVRGYEPPEGHPDWTKGSGDSGSSGYGLGGWEAIKSGDAKVYSLVDAKGEPHVTIEVGKARPTKADLEKQPQEVQDEFQRRFDNWVNNIDYRPNPEEIRRETELLFRNMNIPTSERINQIKGKQNAKPKDDYLPFVQDFVKGSNWSDVGDLKNTNLRSIETVPERARFESAGMKLPKYVTDADHENLINEYMKLTSHPTDLDFMHKEYGFPKPDVPPDLEGMKRGGVVISNNPDTMMMELGNKRMKEGGSEDDTKPYFGGAGTKKYAAAKKRAEQGDVNTLKDPRTYATVAGFMGERPDEMGFSVMHPDYQGVREAADPAFYAGTALGIAPLGKALNAPFAAIGKALEPAVGRFVTKTMERGGLGADILTDMGRGTRSYAYLPHTEKSPNPLVGTRYKTQHVGNLAPKFDFDVQAEQGSSVMSNPWDLTSRGEKVLEVSDIPMSNQMITEGGHDFARDIANIKATIGGASGRQIAERMQDRVNDATFANLFDKGTGRVFTMPSTMDVKGSHFSTMPTDLVMDIFQQRGLKPKEVERITDDLRTFVFETEKGKFRNAAPVGSPEFMLQLRQGGKGFSAGDLRKGLMDRMSKSEYQQMLGYNIEDVYGAIGDQALKGLPKGFVGNTMIETSPFAGLKPATHQSYDTANMGKYAGSMPSMPLELMMPDLFRAIEINYLKNPKYQKLTPLQLRTMIVNTIEKRGNVISQPINQRVVDNVMRYKQGLAQGHFKPNDYDSIMEFMRRTGGYKDGGAVHKAEGGEVSGDDLILEERPL